MFKWESTLPASFRQNRHEGMGPWYGTFSFQQDFTQTLWTPSL